MVPAPGGHLVVTPREFGNPQRRLLTLNYFNKQIQIVIRCAYGEIAQGLPLDPSHRWLHLGRRGDAHARAFLLVHAARGQKPRSVAVGAGGGARHAANSLAAYAAVIKAVVVAVAGPADKAFIGRYLEALGVVGGERVFGVDVPE